MMRVFAFIYQFFGWMPPVMFLFVVSIGGIFWLYLVTRILKLIWDVLPIA